MALVVETGTGADPAANSYATVADCTAYHEAHLYATPWTNATAPNKEIALRMATRVLDQSVAWYGYLAKDGQPLQWPRVRVPNRQRFAYTPGVGTATNFWPANQIPKPIRDATCELARVLLEGDRTKDAAWKGIEHMNIAGEIEFTFDKTDRAKTFTNQVEQMLQPFGRFRFKGSGMRRVVRGQ